MFSIIIPARIYGEVLKYTLSKISSQTYKNFEVLVILDFDDSSINDYENVRFIISGIKSPGEKRNIGIKESKGQYIAFLDDDAYPYNQWLEKAEIIFRSNPEYIGLCGPSVTPEESSFLEKIGGFIYESFLTSGPTRYRHLPLKERLVSDYPSVNLIIKKECLEEIGGFNEKFWPGEDTKLCLDLTKNFGKKILYSPLLVVYHFRRSIFHPHLIQLSRYASHRGFFAKIFPETSLKISYFIPSIFLFYLLFIPFTFIFSQMSLFYLLPLVIYIAALFFEGVSIYLKSGSLATSMLAVIGIFFSNITYGAFFLKGIISKPNLLLREVDIVNDKYIKG